MNQYLAPGNRRASAGGCHRTVDPSTSPFGAGRATPDSGEVGIGNRLKSSRGHDLTLCFADPQLEAVGETQPLDQRIRLIHGDRITKDLVLHRAHGAHIRFLGHPPHGHADREWNINRKSHCLTDHDRFRLIRHEGVRQ